MIAAFLATVLPLMAEFESWTNTKGESVDMKLREIVGSGDEISGVFIMRNGKEVTVKKSDLDEQSAKKMDDRKAPSAGKPSVFDAVIDGNLLVLKGDTLEAAGPSVRPLKYHVFYYTASWCGPCRKFTPMLVDFYNQHKNDNFEVILISSDRDETAMANYAIKNKMPWPLLKFDSIKSFRSKFNHGVRGIPSVIVCDSEGNIITSHGRDLNALKQLVK